MSESQVRKRLNNTLRGVQNGAIDAINATDIDKGLLATNEGKILLNTLFPNDFEYYMLAFDLIDSDDKVIERVSFPVMPNEMTINEYKIQTVTKTASGVTTTVNDSYVPQTISISGTFGRRLRAYSGLESNLFAGISSLRSSDLSFKKTIAVSPTVRTGFGHIKNLEEIYKKSTRQNDRGKPYRIIMYNLAFNQVAYIEFESATFSQTMDNNMMWNYSMQIKTVAEVEQKKLFDTLIKAGKTAAEDLLGSEASSIVGGSSSTISTTDVLNPADQTGFSTAVGL